MSSLREGWQRSIASACVVAAVAGAALAPALAMLLDSVRGEDGFSLAAYAGVLGERRQQVLLARSAAIAAGSALLALGWGLALACWIHRLRGWKALLVETLSYLPLLVPSIVVALGWVALCGRSGALTGLLEGLGLPKGALDLYTPAGVAFVLSLCTFPCVSILALQGLRTLDPAALSAARLSAGPWRRLWHVWRPLLAPHLAGGALLAFLLALADFGVPSALMVNVYPIEVFTQFSAYFDVRRAIASAAPAALLAAALCLARLALVRRAPPPRASHAARGAPEGRTSILALVLGVAALLFAVGLPLGVLVLRARGAWAEALRTAGEQVLTSLWVALLGTALLLGAALPFAFALRALGRRARALGEALALVPLFVPGTVVGLGILLLVARGVWPFAAVYPHPAILAYADLARFLSFPALVLASASADLHPDLFRAAAVHGVAPGRSLARIGVPLLAPALAAAATLSFVLALGELSAAVLVSPPGSMTLPVRLASLLHFGKDSIVAALCAILAGLVTTVLFLGLLLAGGPVRFELQHADRAP